MKSNDNALTQYDPFGLAFGRIFDDMLGRNGLRVQETDRLLAPLLDITEDEQALTVTAELPGLTKDDVQIQVENGVLTISGEKKQETTETKGKSWHRMERRYGAIHRAISLPTGIAAESAEAKFENGVLTVTIPKREDVKPRAIKIK